MAHERRQLELDAPVEFIEGDHERGGPQAGVALCLSGGGYRAMLFHLGSLWRLNEFGYLPSIDRVSSVSGGSITSALLGLKWSSLDFDDDGVAPNFAQLIAPPLRAIASVTIDARSIIRAILHLGSAAENVRKAYQKHLYGEATLQDLPERPSFVINATNVQSGVLWRFSKAYMADYRVGFVPDPETLLATAVGASSAFPPVLSPAQLELADGAVHDQLGTDLHRPPFTRHVFLTDGGVYDNLGLETAFKRYQTVIVSDGGGNLEPDPKPATNWAQHGLRVVGIIDNQVGALRKRRLIAAYVDETRTGAYWAVRTDIENYGLDDSLPCPVDETLRLAGERARLGAMPELIQERLINWGYAVTDAAMRAHVEGISGPPPQFPYPHAGVGSN